LDGKAGGSTNTTPVLPSGGFGLAATPQAPPTGFFPGQIDEVRVFTFNAGPFNTDELLVNQAAGDALAATWTTATASTLDGSVSAFAFATSVWFEWGTSAAFGNVTAPMAVDGSVTHTNFSQGVSGLTPGDTILFRAVSSNMLGVMTGPTLSFVTPGA